MLVRQVNIEKEKSITFYKHLNSHTQGPRKQRIFVKKISITLINRSGKKSI